MQTFPSNPNACDEKGYYAILELPPGASVTEVEKKARELSAKYHSDKNPGDKAAAIRFTQIQEAKDNLLNPQFKIAYDSGKQHYTLQVATMGSAGGQQSTAIVATTSIDLAVFLQSLGSVEDRINAAKRSNTDVYVRVLFEADKFMGLYSSQIADLIKAHPVFAKEVFKDVTKCIRLGLSSILNLAATNQELTQLLLVNEAELLKVLDKEGWQTDDKDLYKIASTNESNCRLVLQHSPSAKYIKADNLAKLKQKYPNAFLAVAENDPYYAFVLTLYNQKLADPLECTVTLGNTRYKLQDHLATLFNIFYPSLTTLFSILVETASKSATAAQAFIQCSLLTRHLHSSDLRKLLATGDAVVIAIISNQNLFKEVSKDEDCLSIIHQFLMKGENNLSFFCEQQEVDTLNFTQQQWGELRSKYPKSQQQNIQLLFEKIKEAEKNSPKALFLGSIEKLKNLKDAEEISKLQNELIELIFAHKEELSSIVYDELMPIAKQSEQFVLKLLEHKQAWRLYFINKKEKLLDIINIYPKAVACLFDLYEKNGSNFLGCFIEYGNNQFQNFWLSHLGFALQSMQSKNAEIFEFIVLWLDQLITKHPDNAESILSAINKSPSLFQKYTGRSNFLHKIYNFYNQAQLISQTNNQTSITKGITATSSPLNAINPLTELYFSSAELYVSNKQIKAAIPLFIQALEQGHPHALERLVSLYANPLFIQAVSRCNTVEELFFIYVKYSNEKSILDYFLQRQTIYADLEQWFIDPAISNNTKRDLCHLLERVAVAKGYPESNKAQLFSLLLGLFSSASILISNISRGLVLKLLEGANEMDDTASATLKNAIVNSNCILRKVADNSPNYGIYFLQLVIKNQSDKDKQQLYHLYPWIAKLNNNKPIKTAGEFKKIFKQCIIPIESCASYSRSFMLFILLDYAVMPLSGVDIFTIANLDLDQIIKIFQPLFDLLTTENNRDKKIIDLLQENPKIYFGCFENICKSLARNDNNKEEMFLTQACILGMSLINSPNLGVYYYQLAAKGLIGESPQKRLYPWIKELNKKNIETAGEFKEIFEQCIVPIESYHRYSRSFMFFILLDYTAVVPLTVADIFAIESLNLEQVFKIAQPLLNLLTAANKRDKKIIELLQENKDVYLTCVEKVCRILFDRCNEKAQALLSLAFNIDTLPGQVVQFSELQKFNLFSDSCYSTDTKSYLRMGVLYIELFGVAVLNEKMPTVFEIIFKRVEPRFMSDSENLAIFRLMRNYKNPLISGGKIPQCEAIPKINNTALVPETISEEKSKGASVVLLDDKSNKDPAKKNPEPKCIINSIVFHNNPNNKFVSKLPQRPFDPIAFFNDPNYSHPSKNTVSESTADKEKNEDDFDAKAFFKQ